MPTWNYRVIHREQPFPDRHGEQVEHWYAIHEVYYDDDGKPRACSTNPAVVGGETVAELHAIRMRMFEATRRPVLEWTDFENEPDKMEVR